MTVNEFIRKVKYDIMLSSLDIPLTCNGKSIKEVEILEDEDILRVAYENSN